MLWQAAHKTYLDNIQSYLEDPVISISACESAAQICHKHFLELLEVSRVISFESAEAEILFFKDIQSKVYAHLGFFKLAGSFLIERLTLDAASQRKHSKRTLTTANKMPYRYKDFYHYILLDKNHLDFIYFTRPGCPDINLDTSFIFDPKCTTPHSLLLGKITGYRLFSKYVIRLCENNHGTSKFKNTQTLKWTGKKVDLIELIYALQASGVINHGDASIKSIADSLQEQFGCSIGDIYRNYTDLRYRKKSRTKFLDQLSEKLSEKMESEEA